MSKIVFLNQPSVGHTNTLLSIALQMRDEGHETRFLLPGVRGRKVGVQLIDTAFGIADMIERNGLAVEVMPPSPATILPALILPRTTGYHEIQTAVRLFASGIQHYARQIIEALAANKPDMIVSDFAFYGASVAADVLGLPYATIYHSGLPFRGEMVPPFGSGLPIVAENAAGTPYDERENQFLKQIDQRLNRARQAFGLAPTDPGVLRRPYSPWLNLVTSVEAIEAPRSNLTRNTLYIGPCFGKRRPMHADFPFDQLRADKVKIYVSLGTVFNSKLDVYRRIINGLDHPDYQVIVSAGGSYERLRQKTLPANVALFKSVPQVELLPQVDIVIGHGGNNSTNETLAAGKPLIVLPVGGEQGDNARRVEYLGAGLRLDLHSFTAQDVAQAAATLCADARFAARAAALKEAVSRADGPTTAAACIAWVARQRKPLNRPAGMPLTITPAHLPDLLG